MSTRCRPACRPFWGGVGVWGVGSTSVDLLSTRLSTSCPPRVVLSTSVDQVYTSSYRRFVVCCGHPEHASQKADCRKRRNFGVRAASASGLDLMEPYAYLGAWLRAAALYEDAASHERYNPNEAAVKAYAAEQGWS